MKYGEKLDFFEMAQKQGVEIKAMNEYPVFNVEESFYWKAFGTLSDANYSDISKFCEDNLLTIDERDDLIRMINNLRDHRSKVNKNANS